jgi:hypothetical protein
MYAYDHMGCPNIFFKKKSNAEIMDAEKKQVRKVETKFKFV